VKILVLTNLYPPHHAGTFDLRCQEVVEALRLRGHVILILTSNHALNNEQRDGEIHRRLFLNGVYGHPLVNGYRDMLRTEQHNHAALRDAVTELQPDLVFSASAPRDSRWFTMWPTHGSRPAFARTPG
jgi:hypothetical protein